MRYTQTDTMKNYDFSRRSFMKATAGIGAASSTLVSGCLSQDGSGRGDASTIDFDTIEGNLNIMLFRSGMEQGFWEDEGVSLNIEQVPFGRYTTSMTSGGNDVGIMGYPIFCQYNDGEYDFVHFGPCITQINSILVPADSDLETVEDLQGATLGHPGWQTATATLMRGLISDQFGFDIREETEGVQSQPSTLWSLMVDQGDIDAMVQFTGQTVRGLASPDEVRPLYNAWEGWEEQTGYPPLITPFTTTRSYLDENPENVLAVAEGWKSAQDYFLNNTESVVNEYGELAGLSDEANRETIVELAQDGAMTQPVNEYNSELIDSQWQLLNVLNDLDLVPSVPEREDHVISISDLRSMAGATSTE